MEQLFTEYTEKITSLKESNNSCLKQVELVKEELKRIYDLWREEKEKN